MYVYTLIIESSTLLQSQVLSMPLTEEILDKVGQAKILLKLDLLKGFYQVPLTLLGATHWETVQSSD